MDSEYAGFMCALLERSGAFIAERFRRGEFQVDLKPDRTIVTEADREAEAVMREMIAGAYPGHGVIGEEFGPDRAEAEFVWTLDPIDGTISFAGGSPLFGTLVGLLHHGQPILGAFHQPVLGHLCMGDGRETRWNDRPVRVRATATLAEATLLTTDVKEPARQGKGRGFEKLLAATGLFRTWGDCYGYFLVATGRADIMVDPIMNVWDLVPLIPIIRGAGGAVSDWTGGDPVRGDSLVAAHPRLHAAALHVLNA